MKFFVYGTLKEGGSLAGRFDPVRQSSVPAALNGYDLYELGWFPGIVLGDGRVQGEIHTYSNERGVLEAFDRIEGYDPENEGNSLYLRKTVTVTTRGGEVKAFVYIFNQKVPTNSRLIKDGCWPV
jgi:gamma-glutamylcyclotransferase (GGCT)/AIG2-like uncharacterized protein YtfP